MKTVILCGGYGTRLAEETKIKPKPMVKIGKEPILEHILNIYRGYKFKDFVLALGYKSEYIKDYYKKKKKKKINLVYTGKNTMTGGRLLRLKKYLKDEETFMLTYGDGVADVNIKDLLKFHKSHGKLLTMTSAQPDGRFGALDIDDKNKVNEFKEKPKGDGSWINAGYFVCEPEVFEYIKEGDETVFEQSPLRNLAKKGEIYTYKHNSFWMPMDTIRDKNVLNDLWLNNKAAWKTWK